MIFHNISSIKHHGENIPPLPPEQTGCGFGVCGSHFRSCKHVLQASWSQHHVLWMLNAVNPHSAQLTLWVHFLLLHAVHSNPFNTLIGVLLPQTMACAHISKRYQGTVVSSWWSTQSGKGKSHRQTTSYLKARRPRDERKSQGTNKQRRECPAGTRSPSDSSLWE